MESRNSFGTEYTFGLDIRERFVEFGLGIEVGTGRIGEEICSMVVR